MTSHCRWPVGCQARPWLLAWGAEQLQQHLPEAMAQIAQLGFDGFELRMDCLPLTDRAWFAKATRQAGGLALCGAHAGGPWWSENGPEAVEQVAEQATRLPDLGCTRLVLSMQQPREGLNEHQRSDAIERIGKLAHTCSRSGVHVVFHNHAFELTDDARMLQQLVDEIPADLLGLAPDLGFVARSSIDVGDFLHRFADRIEYLHLRDVAADSGAFVEVGAGTVNYPSILAVLATIGYPGWFVAELDTAAGGSAAGPQETARIQIEALRAVLNTRNG